MSNHAHLIISANENNVSDVLLLLLRN